jgi:hypothetical protein
MCQVASLTALPPRQPDGRIFCFSVIFATAPGYPVHADPEAISTLVVNEFALRYEAADQDDAPSSVWIEDPWPATGKQIGSAGRTPSRAEPDIFSGIEFAAKPSLVADWHPTTSDTDTAVAAALTPGGDQFVLTGKKSITTSPQPQTLSQTSPHGKGPAESPASPVTAPAPIQAASTPAPVPALAPTPVAPDVTTTAAATIEVAIKVEASPAPAPYSLQVSRAVDFIHSLGVNTHLGNPSYDNVGLVLDQLAYIGVHHIRDWFPEQIWPLQYSQISTLTSAGIKLDALLPNINPVDLDVHIANLASFAHAHPGVVTSVEGPNEIDASPIAYREMGGIEAVQALQKDFYAAVHSSADLAGVPVYNFTTAWLPQSAYGIGDMSAYADNANVHGYVPNGLRPADWLPQTIHNFASNVPGKPIVVTETNYYTLPQDSEWGGVNQNVQAKYGLYTALDNWKSGIAATFFYELRDQGSDANRENNFGLFQANGLPKTFAMALHNLTTILSDPGAGANSFELRPLTVSFSGLPDTASAQLLQKSDGTSDLVVWDEQQIWDPVNHVQRAAAASDVTIFLQSTVAEIQIFDPLLDSAPVATYHDVSQFTVHLLDAPLVLHLI